MKVFKERKKDLSRFNSDFNSILLFKTLLDSKSLEIRIIPIFYQDEPKLIISLNDCTDLMTIELLKRTDEYKNILMSYVSHELRTPLNGMLAMIESLKERVSAEINEQFIDPSLSCGRNLLYLINDILDFEQIRKGKMRLFESDFRLRNCLEDALNIVRLQSHKKGLELYLSIDNQIPISISTDANRLRQIVLNLLGNALKFTIKGSITLQVTPYKSDSHVLQVKYSIISNKNTKFSLDFGY
jgi:signal transduction histidine kinase